MVWWPREQERDIEGEVGRGRGAAGEFGGWTTADNVCQQTLTGLYHSEVSVLEELRGPAELIVLRRERTHSYRSGFGVTLSCVCVCVCV